MLSQSPRSAGMSVYALMQPQSSDDSPQYIRRLIQDRFDAAMSTLPTRREHTDTGLVTDLGDIIIHLLSMVTKMTDDIVDDRRIKQRAYGAMVEDRNARRYTLAMNLQEVDSSHRVLKNMQATLKNTLNDFSQAWQKPAGVHHPAAVAHPVSVSVSASEHIPSPSSTLSRSSGSLSAHDLQMEAGFQTQQTASPEVTKPDHILRASETAVPRSSVKSEPGTGDQAFADPDMEALRNRGKGTYTCKYGLNCTKGGVDMYGQLVIFERNCMFRQHMDKHKKPYKCTKPGCPNKDGFARKDQLERHINNVKHDVP